MSKVVEIPIGKRSPRYLRDSAFCAEYWGSCWIGGGVLGLADFWCNLFVLDCDHESGEGNWDCISHSAGI